MKHYKQLMLTIVLLLMCTGAVAVSRAQDDGIPEEQVAPSLALAAKVDVFFVDDRDSHKWRVSYDGLTASSTINSALGLDIRNFAFGDFDGNGKTDVFYVDDSDGHKWRVSYGGVTSFQTINSAPGLDIHNFAFGDFDGNGETDVFLSLIHI